MPSRPLALRFTSILHLLDFLTRDRHEIKVVIICSDRDSFIRGLIELVNAPEPNSIQEAEYELLTALLRHLLTPSINNIALIRNVSVTFMPTLAHLRAYLSSGRLILVSSQHEASEMQASRMQSKPPLVAVYGSLDLHHGTSEFSAQGLSRTMALLVEATWLAGARLVMAECDRNAEQETVEITAAPINDGLISPFAMKVPVLNRAIGYGRDERYWAGKTVQVGRIWARWCHLP